MRIFQLNLMTPKERASLQGMDDLIISAAPETLERIQSIDRENQLRGISLHGVCLDSGFVIRHSVKKP